MARANRHFFKIAAGAIEPDAGTQFLQPNTSLRYLPQEPDLTGYASIMAFAKDGLGPTDDPHCVQYLFDQLGLTGAEDPARLSGGEARRAALVRVLAPQPDILLLDEPTNHLDLPAIEWLEEELGGLRSALVLISHDRRFLTHLSRATVWLDRGNARRIEAGFADFEAWRDKTLDEEELERHKLDRKIAMEEDWVRYGVTARRRRNQGRMERLQALRAESGVRRAERQAISNSKASNRPYVRQSSSSRPRRSSSPLTDRRIVDQFFDPHSARRPGWYRWARTGLEKRRSLSLFDW